MKRQVRHALLALALAGCVSAPAEDGLREAWRRCILSAEGSIDKVAACKTVLEVMQQHPRHRSFAEQETVRVLDYQRCLTARQTGGAGAINEQCGRVWQEIRNHN
ncbi:ChiQ/YbfN family lipoprotein [Pantoea sp. 1.19]|uniref:ChiQ/YbfN family lipoprotein n=1 Tax=Pantoea sp. 1.19 TaxID=1925589 RepID=UPI00094911D0|nr:ChiQ/YbfN family lipoprotein [Pantoea sp. 1.19]